MADPIKITGETMISLFVEGDEQAFSDLYKRYFNDVFSYGLSLGIDRDKLQDIIQDVFYKVYLNRKLFASEAHIKFYLLKSLRNAAIDSARKQIREISPDSGEPPFFLNTTILDDMMDEEYRAGLEKRLGKLLSMLTDRQREVIFLKYMEELGYPEIAQIMAMTPHGVRKLISRAMSRLKSASKEGGAELLIALLSAEKIIF